VVKNRDLGYAPLVLLALVVFSACTQLRQFRRFFLSRCPAEGPVQETEFKLHLTPVSMETYYRELLSSAGDFPRREIVRIATDADEFPVYYFGPMGTPGSRRVLVIAGVHGNEIAGSLAAPRILRDLREHPTEYVGVEMHVIAPANPVGLKHLSRYNQQGCDINRDFGPFRTREASAVRAVLDQVTPELILSLLEGPHEGFFVIATRGSPQPLAEAVVSGEGPLGIPLAQKNNLGFRLPHAGIMTEGWFITAAKRLLRIRSLGAYAHDRGIPVLTTEGPWGSEDTEARVRAQVLAVRAVAAHLSQQPAASTSSAPNKARERTGGEPGSPRPTSSSPAAQRHDVSRQAAIEERSGRHELEARGNLDRHTCVRRVLLRPRVSAWLHGNVPPCVRQQRHDASQP
jgi:hypothetical protein